MKKSDLDELISEAREWAGSYASWGDNGLVDRLVDALEATTRVPVQGEPNGDREVLQDLLDTHTKQLDTGACCGWVFSSPLEQYLHWADAILAAGFSRATVPDATTERELEAVKEHREKWMARAFRAETERDATVAAIERVRAILNRDDFGDDWEHDEWVYRDAAEKQLSDIEAALDGAPEVEWEYGWAGEDDASPWRLDQEFETVQEAEAFALSADRAWVRREGGHIVRRRKAGPRLPVEGESK